MTTNIFESLDRLLEHNEKKSSQKKVKETMRMPRVLLIARRSSVQEVLGTAEGYVIAQKRTFNFRDEHDEAILKV